MSRLFEPVALGDLHLANRVVMAPMTRSRAGSRGQPLPMTARYYAQRAAAGLIVTEGVFPSPDGQGYPATPGVCTDEQVAAWREVADAVHAAGGRIVMQLMHCGRAALRENQAADAEVIAPSAIACRTPLYGPNGVQRPCSVPRALRTEEIARVVQEYRDAALNAVAAGMDGVELHAASGYLPMQFLSTNTNLREDAYGGSRENRCRFVWEVMQAMGEAIGHGRVGIRINPGSDYNDMADEAPAATYATLLQGLSGRGFAYVHLIHRPPAALDTLMLTRAYWSGPVIVNDELDAARADAFITAGKAEAASFGRPFIANPDLVARFASGAPLASPDRATLYGGGERGYTDYSEFEAP
ncbi:alkene reductase [Brevundimonas sp.]|uniref:alkene reductase n=1 Tax=Brevundimonas sp. TaxID=1871086 RepID=UPI003D6C708E